MHTDLEPDTPPQVYRPLRWPDDSVPPKTLLFYKRRLQETPTVKLVSYRRFTYKKTTYITTHRAMQLRRFRLAQILPSGRACCR